MIPTSLTGTPSGGSFRSPLRSSLLVSLLALLIGMWVWEPVPAGVWNDDGAYLLLAESLAQGNGLRYSGVPETPPGAKFPPLYPLSLSLAWRLAPDAVAEGAGGGLLNVLFLSFAAGAMWLFVRRELGLGPAAAGVSLLPWLSPDLWRMAMVSLSEPLFVLLLIVALWGLIRASRKGTVGAFVLAGVLLGLLALTRTIGVVVVGAGVVTLAWERRWRDVGLVAFVVSLFLVPWSIWSGRAAVEIAAPLQELMGPYGRWLATQTLTDPAASVARAIGATPILARIGFSLFVPGSVSVFTWIIGPVLAAAALVGLVGLGKHARSVVLSVFMYVAVIWIWPHTERRLVAPLLPLLVLGIAGVLRLADERLGSRMRRLTSVAVFGWAAIFAVMGISGLVREIHLASYRVRADMLAPAVAAIRRVVPDGAVVGAPEFWGAIHLHTRHPVAPSARFHPLGGESFGTPQEQFALWTSTGTEYVLLEQGGAVHRRALDELDAQCPGAVQLVASWSGGLLVRLAWDEGCRDRLGEIGDRP
jgi:hypothetical protein